MRILITGKTGQVGWELRPIMATFGQVLATTREQLDLAYPDSIRAVVRDFAPNVIVNTAAYTAVDQAESEPESAHNINGDAPGILAEEARRLGSLLIHFSTDYVFDGSKDTPYCEKDSPRPRNVYGKTKLAGERAIGAVGSNHIIFRTSWVYSTRGKNFLLTILNRARTMENLHIVADQNGTPNWSRMLAIATGHVLSRLVLSRGRRDWDGLHATYHLSASGETTWYEFAKTILELDPFSERHVLREIHPVPTSEYVTRAERPLNSRLNCDAIHRDFGMEPMHWKEFLCMALEEIKEKNS